MTLDEWRATDFTRLERERLVYLDFTGAGLAPESVVRRHAELLTRRVLGNPHARHPASRDATALVDRVRARVLRFFNAAPDEYALIFTANATAALKLVGEAYPFAVRGRLLLTADNHNSVNGLRELARAQGASVAYVPLAGRELRVDAAALERALADRPAGGSKLFAYPAQSNFSGVQHPLSWIAAAQERGWDVLLDAAAFAPTNRLDLRRWRPDFVDLSFYKMLGYPTGTGCLIARHAALAKLRRPWFSGGTITFSSVAGEGHVLARGPAAFEDGTPNFLDLPAVELGLDALDAVGLDAVHARVAALTAELIGALSGHRHGNGRPLARVYGPLGAAGRGGTVAFNLFDPSGTSWDCGAVEALAGERGLCVRAGCHCNPGAREAALGVDERELARRFERREERTDDEILRGLAGLTEGVVRASLGAVSNSGDVRALERFVAAFVDRPVAA
jgi:molybdenum cofactor sulfurtransferase